MESLQCSFIVYFEVLNISRRADASTFGFKFRIIEQGTIYDILSTISASPSSKYPVEIREKRCFKTVNQNCSEKVKCNINELEMKKSLKEKAEGTRTMVKGELRKLKGSPGQVQSSESTNVKLEGEREVAGWKVRNHKSN